MSIPPKIRGFAARLDQRDAEGLRLVVEGAVETPSSNEQPVLSRSQEHNQAERLRALDLTLRNTGMMGSQAFMYHAAFYEEPLGDPSIEIVTLLWRGRVIKTLTVAKPA
ncbi:hypothetical protein GTA62_19675 [Roseobacter sp. HKCCD9010]|uniref:hypothetical protein n=1 Tax=unclassified Roseobacter TaxID=196798 RepID=UPI0014912734|nr:MULTISPECIES: hypothetical protein [unclassified Roseobacter]MBF9052184.1 hypothetical protein [Rhodobacterales bacterium HKCCD4356]NNV14139.1 hypothetical protein [Roseobacter sp. HKCCD7357]NNV18363.1 hypothetical protein [Roseobacter sp. HKCCD8768]NNV27803.1 hypothetical protein [Roseobacter sp. HKCCD8192]NNV32093.1 hypothetical protein [Roseobacter sp. HKCCD9061]